MRTYTVGEFKAQFSAILDLIDAGEKVAITYGKTRKVIAYLVPKDKAPTSQRQLGILAGKASVRFMDDFKITENELANV
jgi:antitoxin (DNA-binding transcriptional repressor) of toxin-antitoxin stability system